MNSGYAAPHFTLPLVDQPRLRRTQLPAVRPAHVVASLAVLRRRGAVVSGVRRMNEVNARRARLVLGWVTVFGRVYHLGM